MVTYSVDVNTLDRIVVAQEVIESAARLLGMVGFEADEIKDIFSQAAQQASEQLSSQNHISDELFNREDEEADEDDYEDYPESKSLRRLLKRGEAISDLDNSGSFGRALKIALEAVPLAAAIQNKLVLRAEERGIQLVRDKRAWTLAASDDDLDREEDFLFLAEHQSSYYIGGDLVISLLRAAVQNGDTDSFSRLHALIQASGVQLLDRDMEEIETHANALAQYEPFNRFIRARSGAGELLQSSLLAEFQKANGAQSGTYFLESWLEAMESRGELQRYKQSNRWRILIN